MELYVIALKELGINNKIINLLIENLNFLDFASIFKGNYLEIQFKYNLDLNKFSDKLTDIKLLEQCILNAKSIIKDSKKEKIKIILINNKNYPKNLKLIENPPPILYFKGRGFYKKHEKSIACIGTRNPSNFSYTAIDSLVPRLVEEEFTIVSGLATGVDSYSHKACLDHNGTTIAVLAHGLDMIYPKENISLANEILKNNGLLVSEYPIRTKPDKFRFVDRNRIVSGLSKSVIVFETKEKSGTMRTVDYAVQQNKKIFCPLPSTITELTSKLNNLIESGVAKPLATRSAYDIVVYESGYKIKKDKSRANKYKSKIVSSIINDLNANNNTIYNSFNKKSNKSKQIAFSLDEELHTKLSEYVNSNNITKKELFNALVLSILENNNL